MQKFVRSVNRPTTIRLFIALYLCVTAIGAWSFWSALETVRNQLRSDLYSLTVDLVRTMELTGRYMIELDDYLQVQDGPAPKLLLQHIEILKARPSVLTTPFARIAPDAEFAQFFHETLDEYAHNVDEIGALLASAPLHGKDLTRAEDLLFDIEETVSLLYTRSQSYIQGRTTVQRDVQEILSIVLVGLVAAAMLTLGGLILVLLKFYEQRVQLREQALTDPLTGLHNRRYYLEVGDVLFATAQRTGTPLSLIIIDIDHFKPYNDTYGHKQGDNALVAVAQVLNTITQRNGDLAFRIGGEEFCCLITTERVEDAKQIAERICSSIEALGIAHATSAVSPVITASLGVASMPGRGITSKEVLFERADNALYAAKDAGRNRVIVA